MMASPPSSPYFQLEFTAEDDMAAASDAEQSSEGPIRNNASQVPSTPTGASAQYRRTRQVDNQPAVMTISARAFFVALILLVFVTSFACRGVLHGILRILQEDVDLSGGETITLALSFDFGFVIVVVMMALQDRKIHRPKSIGFGGFLIGLGLLITCIPYFIIRSDLENGPWYVSKYELCGDKNVIPPINQSSHDDRERQLISVINDPPRASWTGVAWIVMGLAIAGIGAVPQLPLGITYLEDRLRGFGTPFYVGILLCSYLLGIWFGDLVSFFMWHHVGNADSATVAFWWLGFFCSALVALVLGIFIFMGKDPYKRLVNETKGLTTRGENRTENGLRYQRLVSGEENPQSGN